MVNDISHIYKFIYISNYKTASDIDLLQMYDIKAVLHIGLTPNTSKILQDYKAASIKYKFIKMGDTPTTNISNGCNETCNFINKQINRKINVLVHCKHGVSRSPTVVACYLMRLLYIKTPRTKPVLNDILSLINIYRPCIKPNDNFINQLKCHEAQICNAKSQL